MYTPGAEREDQGDELALVLTREDVCHVLGVSKRQLIRLTTDGILDSAPGEDQGSHGGRPRKLYSRSWLTKSRAALGRSY
jgi:predicted ArsR family transcriptional regulator